MALENPWPQVRNLLPFRSLERADGMVVGAQIAWSEGLEGVLGAKYCFL